MGTIKKPIFPTVEELGNKCFDKKVFKKIIRVTKRVSSVKMASVFKFTGIYNKKYGTNFFVEYKKMGDSNTYELKNITCTKQPEKVIEKTEDGLVKGNQYILFDIQPTQPSDSSVAESGSWITSSDADYPMGTLKKK